MNSVTNIPTLQPEAFKNLIAADKEHWRKTRLNDFLIHNIASYSNKLKLPFPPHRKTVNDFIVVTEGSMTKTSGLDSHKINKNSVYFLPAGQIRTTEKISKEIQGYYCHFSNDFLTENNPHFNALKTFAFADWINNPLIKIPPGEFEIIISLLKRMEEIYLHSPNFELIRSYLITVLTEFKSQINNHSKRNLTSQEILFQRFKQLIIKNVKKLHDVENYSSLLKVSPNHLNKAIKQATGKPASAIINEMLILESKVLLSQSTKSVSEVGYVNGFEDPSYFGRFFKKHTGKTPTEFRKMIDSSE